MDSLRQLTVEERIELIEKQLYDAGERPSRDVLFRR
jgi:hypothetical protein